MKPYVRKPLRGKVFVPETRVRRERNIRDPDTGLHNWADVDWSKALIEKGRLNDLRQEVTRLSEAAVKLQQERDEALARVDSIYEAYDRRGERYSNLESFLEECEDQADVAGRNEGESLAAFLRRITTMRALLRQAALGTPSPTGRRLIRFTDDEEE